MNPINPPKSTTVRARLRVTLDLLIPDACWTDATTLAQASRDAFDRGRAQLAKMLEHRDERVSAVVIEELEVRIGGAP